MMSSPMVLSLLLFVSLTALLLLAPRLSPPPPPVAAGDQEEVPAAGVGVGGAGSGGPWGVGVGEEADDLALFRRATLDAGAGAAVSAAPSKVAFLFLTNSDLTFGPLWERFFAGHEGRFSVYVHADPAAQLLLPPTPSFRGRFVAAKPTRRADPSLIAAERRLLAAALLDDAANVYFALLSQHCVPLQSFARLYGALFPPRAAHHHRLPSYIEVLTGEPQMPSRYVARGEDAMLPEVPYDRFRIGSQFFTLARRHAALVVGERRLWRKFRVPCLPEMQQDSCYPEEHYFPTLLDMADSAGVARYTLTRVNWTGSVAGHPHTYTAPEVSPRLIAQLRASNHTHPYMFARKFAPDCLGPLLAIADTVLFKD
ncbi:glycosyltransferase BC10-like [Phragmites australis]|uniref:glycosyltransferase BC10-like n=1 Tax=Phragmites australis TaxID=29695 RepID=UPI002D76F59A|nr:glycosyltransferase BC10-like [Phragmites australis]